MSVEAVRNYFAQMEKDVSILTFKDTSTVPKAAAALGVTPGEIAKSLLLQVRDDFVMVVMAGDKKLHNGKFKKIFKAKPKMPDFEQVVEITGHPVGGVCPFGLRNPIKVYLDDSLKKYAKVYPAAGASNAAVALRVDELDELLTADWVDVSEEKQEKESESTNLSHQD